MRGGGCCVLRLSPLATLALFCGVNLISFADRGVIPGAFFYIGQFIKSDLGVTSTDVYIGYASSAFIVGFSLAAIIMGHVVHMYPPFKLMALGLMIWVVSTVICGLAPAYWVLVLGRVLSGVGEASFQCVVPPYIDDHAPPAKRGLYLAAFYAANPVGTAVGYAFGGVMSSAVPDGWRWMFIIEGLAMVPLIACVALLPFERKGAAAADAAAAPSPAKLIGDAAPAEALREPLSPRPAKRGGTALGAGAPSLVSAAAAAGGSADADTEELAEAGKLLVRSASAATAGGGGDAEEAVPLSPPADPLESESDPGAKPGYLAELKTVLLNARYMLIAFGYAGLTGVVAGVGVFAPTIILGMGLLDSPTSASLCVGLVVAVGGALGVPMGGWLIDCGQRRAKGARDAAKAKAAAEEAEAAAHEGHTHHHHRYLIPTYTPTGTTRALPVPQQITRALSRAANALQAPPAVAADGTALPPSLAIARSASAAAGPGGVLLGVGSGFVARGLSSASLSYGGGGGALQRHSALAREGSRAAARGLGGTSASVATASSSASAPAAAEAVGPELRPFSAEMARVATPTGSSTSVADAAADASAAAQRAAVIVRSNPGSPGSAFGAPAAFSLASSSASSAAGAGPAMEPGAERVSARGGLGGLGSLPAGDDGGTSCPQSPFSASDAGGNDDIDGGGMGSGDAVLLPVDEITEIAPDDADEDATSPEVVDIKLVVTVRQALVMGGLGMVALAAAPLAADGGVAAFLLVLTVAVIMFTATLPALSLGMMAAVPPATRALAIGMGILVSHALGDVPALPVIGALGDALSPSTCDPVDTDKCTRSAAGLKLVLWLTTAWLATSLLCWGAALALVQRRADQRLRSGFYKRWSAEKRAAAAEAAAAAAEAASAAP